MITNPIIDFLGSQLFANIILLVTVVVVFAVGYRQIALGDVIEIYAIPGSKQVINATTGSSYSVPIIQVQNVGTQVVYLEKYVFNGSEYVKNGQVLPPTYSQSNPIYWINLPINGATHVSLTLYYYDLNKRHWKSEITADFINNSWEVSSLPRVSQ